MPLEFLWDGSMEDEKNQTSGQIRARTNSEATMKQTVVILMVLALTLFYSSISIAENTALTLTAAASSVFSTSYSPDRAVDGYEYTYWVGGMDKSPWWITFDAGDVNYITKISMKWPYTPFTPKNYDIQVSSDGVVWENVYSSIAGIWSAQSEIKDINKNARYIKFYIRQVQFYFPMISEVKIYGRKNTIPRLMRFQAGLNDASGMPIEGAFNLTFRIYDTETAGTALWQETQNNINIEEGLLNVELGSVTPLNTLAFDKQYWLSVQAGIDPEMTPRFKLTGAPYSFIAQ